MSEGVEAWSWRLMDLHEALSQKLSSNPTVFKKKKKNKVDLSSFISAAHSPQISFGSVYLSRSLHRSDLNSRAGCR